MSVSQSFGGHEIDLVAVYAAGHGDLTRGRLIANERKALLVQDSGTEAEGPNRIGDRRISAGPVHRATRRQ